MRKQKSFNEVTSQGCLYIVATPIGNLEDMTMRAIRILNEVEVIAAEDTRQTRKLLSHFKISARLLSYHEHNKEASGKELVRLMEQGDRIALVSDAGMPAISDPGYELVQSTIDAGLPVIPVPGANAALSALVVSGIAPQPFIFLGFLPKDKKSLQAVMQSYALRKETLVLYESPHRLTKTLGHLHAGLGNRRIALARELTKKHEEVFRGTIEEALESLEQEPPRGEYVVVIEGANDQTIENEREPAWWASDSIENHVNHYIEDGLDKKDAIKQVAQDRGIPKRQVYNVYEKYLNRSHE